MKRACIAWLIALAGATTVNAETVTGTFNFMDGDGAAAPVRNAKVEVWRRRSGHLHWENPLTTATDAQGRVNATVPYVGNDAAYTLRVYATNPATVVYVRDNFVAHFYDVPGKPATQIERTTRSPSDTHNFDWTFSEPFSALHFNTADAMLRGLEYANARKDPRETDTIATVAVQMTSALTYYDPVAKIIRLNSSFAMDDFSLLHEYAHYLEERISGFKGIPSTHDGCTATIGAVHVEEPGHAWMEGFANYFAQAVGLAFGADVDGPMLGTMGGSRIETPQCPGSTVPRPSLEAFVSATLFDLIDSSAEPFDRLCTRGTEIDRIIFQIFDRELDQGSNNPTLQQFVDAWSARGMDLPPLLALTGAIGITVATPRAQTHFDSLPAANLAVWRPGTAQWWVVGGASGTTPVWGEPTDVPVPADYDGDGLTDIAIWRPRDGNWWVRLSASGVSQITQWGTAGDAPLPADYDGDGEVDFAVYRPSDETLYMHSDGCGPHRTRKLGKGMPFVGKFTSAPGAQPGIYDPATGFVVHQQLASGGWTTLSIKLAEASSPTITLASNPSVGTAIGELRSRPTLRIYDPPRPAIGDYDGDGRSDAATYDSQSGIWSLQRSSAGPMTQQWGVAGDIPVPADYDGDKRTDFAIWRPSTGEWWLLQSNGQQRTVQWGANGDVPVPAR